MACLSWLVLLAGQLPPSAPPIAPTWAEPKMPRFLEANVGQRPDGELVLGRVGHTQLAATRAGLIIKDRDTETRLDLVGGSLRRPRFEAALAAKVRQVSGARTYQIPAFERARFEDAWPGVELSLRADDRGYAFELELAAGVDPRVVAFALPGPSIIDPKTGELIAKTPSGELRLSAPVAFQRSGSTKEPVAVAFELEGNRVRFVVGEYDQSRALIIDPFIQYGSYVRANSTLNNPFGASGGFAFVAATMPSSGAVTEPDVYVAKFDPTATGAGSLVWASFLDGSGPGSVINGNGAYMVKGDADAQGRFLLCGTGGSAVVSTDLTTDGSTPRTGAPLVMVVAADGGSIEYAAAFGSNNFEDCKFESNGRYFVVGGRVDSGPLLLNQLGGMNSVAYLARFDLDHDPGTPDDSLVYGTRIGAGVTYIQRLDVDGSGNVTVQLSGYAGLPDVDAQINASSYQSRRDQFAFCKIAPALGASGLLACTYFGGTGVESTAGVAVDATGNVFIAMTSQSFADFPRTAADPMPTAGVKHTALSRLSSDLSTLVQTNFEPSTTSPFMDIRDFERLPNGSFALLLDAAFDAPRTSCSPTNVGGGNFLTVRGSDGRTLILGMALSYVRGLEIEPVVNGLLVGGNPGLSPGELLPILNGFDMTQSNGVFVVVPTTDDCADLGITAQTSSNLIEELETVVWRVNLTNNGTDPATGATVTFTLPAQLQPLASNTSLGTCTLGTPTTTCNLGTVAGSATGFAELTLRAIAPGAAAGSARVASVSYDTNAANDQVSFGVSISPRMSPCGAITGYGECIGDVLSYCADEGSAAERLVSVDCGRDLYPPQSGVTGDCSLVEAVYGYDCTAGVGETCAFDDGNAGTFVTFCRGNAPGCVFEERTGESRCRENVGPCVPPAAGQSFTPVCSGNVLVRACQVDQPIGFDCTTLGAGATCQNAACVGLPAGASCNTTDQLCGSGLVCDTVTNTCIDPASICDDRTFNPTCTGSRLEYCAPRNDRTAEVDCGALQATCGEGFTCRDDGDGTCGRVSTTCRATAANGSCDYVQGVFCGPGQGCVVGFDEDQGAVGRCAQNGTCGPGALHAGCAGNVATFCLAARDYEVVEAGGFDCASFGSDCVDPGAEGQPFCQGSTGARCVDQIAEPNTPFRCAPGYECVPNGTNLGTCERDPDFDGGLPDGAGPGADGGGRDAGVRADAGTSEPEDEGCGCSSVEPAAGSASLPSLAGFALLMVGLMLRRGGSGLSARGGAAPR